MQFFKNVYIGLQLLYESVFYFLFSYLTIFISIFTIKVVQGNEFENVLFTNEVILSFLATIPTYLIGVYYMTHDNLKIIKKALMFFVVISIALFGIVFNVSTIKDMDTIIYITYSMLILSLIFTIISKVNLQDFKNNIQIQRQANDSRERTETTLPNGNVLSI